MKLKEIKFFFKDTKVIKGSKVYLFFIILIYKLVNKSGSVSKKLREKMRNIFPKLFRKNLLIKNNVGTFLVKADDSLVYDIGLLRRSLT